MADRLLGGRLVDRLTELRAVGTSWDDIARTLYLEGGVEVTPETLRNWGHALDIPEPAPDTPTAASA